MNKREQLLELLNEAIAYGLVATFDETTSVYSTVKAEACFNGPQIQITIHKRNLKSEGRAPLQPDGT